MRSFGILLSLGNPPGLINLHPLTPLTPLTPPTHPAFTRYAAYCVFKLHATSVSGGPSEMSDKRARDPFTGSHVHVETCARTALKAFRYANAADLEKCFTLLNIYISHNG